MVGSVYQFDSWTKFRGTRIALSAVAGGLSSAAITDILIAFSLMYYLRLEQGDLNVYAHLFVLPADNLQETNEAFCIQTI